MQIKTIMLVVFSILFVGCGEVEPLETNIQEPRTAPNSESEMLEKLGVKINNQEISLDINKTVGFIKQMEIEMHGKADEIQHKIEKADINFTRDMGILLSEEKVEIDLNKTKKMFQEINILMKEVLLDINSSKN